MQQIDQKKQEDITLFAKTNFRNQEVKFGIKRDDRRRHMYLIGKTGMGKSNTLENMVISDIQAGNGVCLIDPHGDAAEKILEFIPNHRINDVVYFNPSDYDNPIAFNILEVDDPSRKHLVASGLIAIFKKIWADSWGPRLEYLLRNAILALLDNEGSTLLGITRMMTNKPYRKKIIEKIKDPVVKSFWVDEYSKYPDKFQTEAIAPIQNKVGQFLSNSLIRNVVGQIKSTIDMRDIMDNQKIFIVNLSKGRIGEDTSALLGAMIITKIYLAAMSRVDIAEKDRKDFYVYVDEFQNFATESFANILSEARKYRLNLIIAHQYVEQLDEKVASAVFGNVGTIMSFRVGATDAEMLAKEFAPHILEEDFVGLAKYTIYLKLMIDGVSSDPFSASTLPPIEDKTGNQEKVIKVSRERYSRPREEVEDKIARWAETIEEEPASAGKTESKAPFSPNKPTFEKKPDFMVKQDFQKFAKPFKASAPSSSLPSSRLNIPKPKVLPKKDFSFNKPSFAPKPILSSVQQSVTPTQKSFNVNQKSGVLFKKQDNDNFEKKSDQVEELSLSQLFKKNNDNGNKDNVAEKPVEQKVAIQQPVIQQPIISNQPKTVVNQNISISNTNPIKKEDTDKEVAEAPATVSLTQLSKGKVIKF